MAVCPREAPSSRVGRRRVPDDLRDLLVEIFTTVLDSGRGAEPTSDVRRVLGRDAARFTDFVHRVAPTGVWEGHGLDPA